MQRRDVLRAAAAFGSFAGTLPLSMPIGAQPAGNTVVWSGFPPGGLGDQVSRPLMDQLRGKIAQNLVYDAKPGASGRIAAEYVKRAAPDGNTLLQCPAGVMTLHPHVFKKLGYDPFADFVPVAGLCSFAFVFTAGPGLPANVRTVADYVALPRPSPIRRTTGFRPPATRCTCRACCCRAAPASICASSRTRAAVPSGPSQKPAARPSRSAPSWRPSMSAGAG